MAKFIKDLFKHNYQLPIFFISFLSVFGSLFFSEIGRLAPCELCIISRFLMYPLFLIVTLSILLQKRFPRTLILLFSVPGLILSGYHYYIQISPVKNSTLPFCGGGCSSIDWQILGFVTIPLLALLAYAAITIITLISLRLERKPEEVIA